MSILFAASKSSYRRKTVTYYDKYRKKQNYPMKSIAYESSDNLEKLRKITTKLENEDALGVKEVCSRLIKIQIMLEKPKINKKMILDELSSAIKTLNFYGIS